MKKLVVISDLHCGHRAGLTPPEYQYNESHTKARQKYAMIQAAMWDWYSKTVAAIGPVDVLVVNGDAIEGKGERSGGTELIDSDRDGQVEMAEKCIRIMKPNAIRMTYGTASHTGKEEDWEKVLADKLGADIHSHKFIELDGVTFDFKHKIGSSTIPHGRATAPLRDKLWNALWAERELQPKAKIIIRSHVHYFGVAGDATGLVFTTPALQGPGSKYGARECSGTVDVGLMVFECENGIPNWSVKLFDMRPMAERAEKM